MYKQIFYAALALVCLAFILMAWQYEAPYSYEPVGPRAFPLLLLVMLLAGFALLAFRPTAGTIGTGESSHEDSHPLNRREWFKAVQCVALLLIYAALFETAGFVLASVLFAFFFAHLFGGGWKKSLAVALTIPVGLFFLFEKVLDVPLPPGLLIFWS